MNIFLNSAKSIPGLSKRYLKHFHTLQRLTSGPSATSQQTTQTFSSAIAIEDVETKFRLWYGDFVETELITNTSTEAIVLVALALEVTENVLNQAYERAAKDSSEPAITQDDTNAVRPSETGDSTKEDVAAYVKHASDYIDELLRLNGLFEEYDALLDHRQESAGSRLPLERLDNMSQAEMQSVVRIVFAAHNEDLGEGRVRALSSVAQQAYDALGSPLAHLMRHSADGEFRACSLLECSVRQRSRKEWDRFIEAYKAS